MTPRALRSASLLVICLLCAVTSSVFAADPPADPAAILQKLAERKFGALNRAEQMIVRGAAMRDVVWVGPNNDPASPENDLSHADQWGPERTVRAEVIRWLMSDADAAPYVHPSGPGFAAARVKGQIDLSYLLITKPVTMLGCYIPDGIDLSNARTEGIDLRRSSTGTIDADSATIEGDLSMLKGHYGPVSMFRARISGNLDFIGAHVSNPGDEAIVATEATIAGDADFHEGFTTDGIVDFRFAKVGHSLSFNDAHFEGGDDNGLNAERAVVAGFVYWVNIAHTPKTILDLENARAEGFGDDGASWPAAGNLDVNGFVYRSIVDGPANAGDRLRWLRLQTPGYKPQPFQQLAKVLAAGGDDSGATDVLIAQREAQRRLGGLGRLERLWNLMLEVTIGYGFKPLRALWWILAFVVFGAVLFGAGYRLRIITPTEADAYGEFVQSGNAPAHYPPFSAFVYSLENFLPVVELGQGEYWRPNPRHGDSNPVLAGTLRWYLWIHILAGWTLTPLLFAGLSGLIRPG